MALFSRSKTEKKEEPAKNAGETAVAKKAVAQSAAQPTDRNLSAVIIKPHITEKAVGMGEKNVYTFLIHQDATKIDVRDAVKQLFNVTPERVNIVKKSPRQYMARAKGRKVSQSGQKKAYVYLKQGDSIELA